MAISGSFKDVQFTEVLRIVAKRTGRLWIYNFSSNLYSEWFIHQNTVFAVRLNKINLTKDEEVFQAAAKLSEDVTCSYIFYNLPLDRIPSEILLPISLIGLQTIASAAPVNNDEESLPNPDTMFVVSAKIDALMIPDEFKVFWQNSKLQIGEKFSANLIAYNTSCDVQTAQLNLYKLRALGFIKPFRAVVQSTIKFSETQKSQNSLPNKESAVHDTASTARRGLIQRMLEAIRAK